MNIIYLERQLRAGKTPEELGGKAIGSGVCKTAYLFNDSLVVKLNAQRGFEGKAEKTPPKAILKYGARIPRTYKAGNYILQEYVTPVADIKDFKTKYPEAYAVYCALNDNRGSNGLPYDLHAKNVGVDKHGKLVVFDW